MIVAELKIKKGEKLVQIYDSSQEGTKVFIRTARALNVGEHDPITPPNGTQDVSMIADKDFVVKIDMNDKIFDIEGSIYAKYI